MARMKFKNAWNYDSAARQVDTGDFDFILDPETDVGKAFYDVVLQAVTIGMVDFIEIFAQENNLLTQEQADALYELAGAVAAHVLEEDPHSQYLTSDEISSILEDYVTSTGLGTTLSDYVTSSALGTLLEDYSTTAEADALYEPIGEAASAVGGHEGAEDPHSQYMTSDEVDTVVGEAIGAAAFVRDDTTITTASLADEAIEAGDIELAAGYRLLGFECDRACRVRLYITDAARIADEERAIGRDVDIATDHGLVFEYVAEAAADVDLSPLVDGFCPTGIDVFYSVQNLSGSTSVVEVVLDWIRTE